MLTAILAFTLTLKYNIIALIKYKRWQSMKLISQVQQQVFSYICDFFDRENYQPSYQDIQTHFGYSSPGTVRNILLQLEKKGYLKRNGKSRSIQILKPFRHKSIPILGAIAAGKPILAVEEWTETIDDIAEIKGEDGRIALRVRGDSMKDAGILNGDLAIIQTNSPVNNGQIAAVLVNDEVTLKRIYFEQNSVRLQPENERYHALELDRNDLNNWMIGPCVALIRQV